MDNQLNNKSNKKLILILVFILIILILFYAFYIAQSKFNLFCSKCECNKSNTIEGFNPAVAQSIVQIENVEKGIIDIEDGKTYTKIKLSMTNELEQDINMNSYAFYIADGNNEIISMCHGAATMGDNKRRDALPSVLAANSKVSGCIYCETNNTNAKVLELFYVVGFHNEGEGLWQPDFKVMLLDLDNVTSENK